MQVVGMDRGCALRATPEQREVMSEIVNDERVTGTSSVVEFISPALIGYPWLWVLNMICVRIDGSLEWAIGPDGWTLSELYDYPVAA